MSESSKQYNDNSVLTPNEVHHTFVSWLVRKGVPLLDVSRLLGHSTVKITERYAHLEPRESAVRVLSSQDSSHTEVILPPSDNLRRAVSHLEYGGYGWT